VKLVCSGYSLGLAFVEFVEQAAEVEDEALKNFIPIMINRVGNLHLEAGFSCALFSPDDSPHPFVI